MRRAQEKEEGGGALQTLRLFQLLIRPASGCFPLLPQVRASRFSTQFPDATHGVKTCQLLRPKTAFPKMHSHLASASKSPIFWTLTVCIFDVGSHFYSFSLLTLSWLILLPFLILLFQNRIKSAFPALSSRKMQAAQTFLLF